MKKFMKLMAFAMAMTLVFGMTVSAAESPTTEDQEANTAFKVVQEVGAVTEDGANLTVNKAALTGEQYTAAKAAVDGAVIADVTKKSIVAALDVTVPDATAEQLAKGITVTFAVDGVKTGSSYVVFHLKADGTWEQLTAAVPRDGYVSATFTSFSPVVVVEVVKAASSDNNGGSSDSGSANSGSDSSNAAAAAPAEAAVSPKTGEMFPAAGIMAVICLAGASFCAVKVRKNQ